MNSEVLMFLPNEEYHHGERYKDYLSSTQLKQMLVSPKHFKYALTQEEEQSAALHFGSLYHDCLECIATGGTIGDWRSKFVPFVPPINPSTGKAYGKDTQKYLKAIEDAKSAYPDRVFEDLESIESVSSMVLALLEQCGDTSNLIRKCIAQSDPEISVFCEYEGAKFKYRPDLYSEHRMIDWKTVATDTLNEQTVNSCVSKFGYHISAAFYQFFEHERTGKWVPFYWVFQSKEPPYDAVMASAELWAYSDDGSGVVQKGPGALAFEALLNQYLYCLKHDDYRGAEILSAKDGSARVLIPTPSQGEYFKVPTFYND